MRLSKEDYKRANDCLKRYNYNTIKIMSIKDDFMSISAMNMDGMPKAKYNITDNVFNGIWRIQTDVELQRASIECKIVNQALLLVGKDSNIIFEELYKKGTSKWEIINKLHTSEETYKRRKRDLIYAVDEEFKKIDPNLTFFK